MNYLERLKKHYPEIDIKNIKCPECQKQLHIKNILVNSEAPYPNYHDMSFDILIEINIDTVCYECDLYLDFKKNKYEKIKNR